MSIETAFPIHAGDSATAIMLEYRALERLFGRMNHDWKLQDRCVFRASDGRAIEKFTIGTRGNRAEVFFDISSWYGKDSEQQTKRIVEEVIGRSSHENISITLPAGDLLALTTLLMVKGAATPSQGAFDFGRISEEVVSICIQYDLPDEAIGLADTRGIQVELAVPDWIAIYAFLRDSETTDPSFNERVEDLKAYIEDALYQDNGKR